jgi:ABC-type cobalt transport system, ATPase component
MNAYEEVLSWAETRPWWQQKVLARIIAGVTFGEHDYEDIARSLMEEPESPPDGGWFSNLTLPPVTQDEPVRMIAVRKLANVNRLAPGQELTFEPNGLTVVYGHNGSGKSGYARVISSMVGARHQKKILSDVFDNEPRTPSGEIVFEVGDKERTVILGQSPDPELKRIAFYDEYCGNSYLTTDAEISYRPSAVKLLEDLAVVCTGVSQVIKAWTQEKSQPTPLPRVDPQGSAGEFLRGLSASTSDDAVEAAIQCPADAAEQLEKQKIIVARLRASNPNHEKAQLLKISEELTTIADHLETLDTKVGMQAAQQLADLVANAELAQEMANLVSRRTFANEPLSEVGSSVWKVLWSAAEAYSKVAYPDHPFPYTSDGAVCVLCQQRIDAEAADRLESFQRFVMDTTVEEAKDAQSQVDKFRDGLRGLIERPEKISKAIIQLEVKKYPRVEELNSILVALRDRTLALAEGEEAHSVDVAATVAFLRKDAVTHRYQAHRVNVEEFAKQLRQAEAQERQLCDQIAMHDGWQLIEDERTRLQAKEKLEKKLSETNTASITKKVGELTRAYVTQEADEFFTREAQNLGLEHVRFRATSARQGSQFHRTEFRDARSGTKLTDVLSEGEQTSLGFVGFLTEAHFDASKSALIFDDPVSSLDHMKRESVARRIVELAKERQVVVFTHDVAFTMLLRKAADEIAVPYATRGIEKRRKAEPGYTTEHHPWIAKDAAQRVDKLKQEVAALRRQEKGMPGEDYQRETEKIAGHMSQTWERIISQVIAEPLVDFVSLEVRVGKLRIIGRVTEQDVKTYDDSYGRISAWASRHDPNPALNYVPPTVEELKSEIDVIEDWLNRVKKYQR